MRVIAPRCSQSIVRQRDDHRWSWLAGRFVRILALLSCLNGFCASTLTAQVAAVDDTGHLRANFSQLIDAENRHDLPAVAALLLDSSSTLFVAKSPDGWKGYWGKSDVTKHFGELYNKPFRMYPDYATEKIVFLTPDVAETYVNVKIQAEYGGFVEPSPFVVVLVWVKSSGIWKMATDIPIPVPHETAKPADR